MEELRPIARAELICGRLGHPRELMTPLEQITPSDVGERLRIAREGAGLNQSNPAGSIEGARPTLIAIEQGQRRVRMNELQELARLYGTSVNALLRQEAIQVDLAPRFRKLIGSSNAAADAADKFSKAWCQIDLYRF